MKRKPPPAKSALILASASPRRAQLLREAGYAFEVKVSPAKEPAIRPRDVPIAVWPAVLAFIKASAVQKHVKEPGAIVLGADTIVVAEGRVLNKARDRAHARHMLSRLFGKEHQVITGIALVRGESVRLATATSVCYVKKPTNAWLEKYLDEGFWKGKAGAYGIQDGDELVTLRSGEFTNVMGLPMDLLRQELATFPAPAEPKPPRR